jgi:predicted metal-dependent hydrolase
VPSASPQLPLFPPDSAKPDQAPGFAIRPSARAKRLSIKVFPRGRVEVVVPRKTRPGDVQAFVEENREWIEKTRRSFAVVNAPEDFALPDIIHLRSIGRVFRVRYAGERDSKTVRYRLAADVLTLSGRVRDEQMCVMALRRWLMGMARRAFTPQITALSVVTETPFRKLQIRCQRTCWGSRSCSGTISLNLCLLFLDPELTRYLMIHELCHGRHMNHSRRFWKRVATFEPDFRALDRQLGESWREVPAWLGIY